MTSGRTSVSACASPRARIKQISTAARRGRSGWPGRSDGKARRSAGSAAAGMQVDGDRVECVEVEQHRAVRTVGGGLLLVDAGERLRRFWIPEVAATNIVVRVDRSQPRYGSTGEFRRRD